MKEIEYYYWIQKHDYSSIEKEDVNLEQSIKVFFDYDWNNELSNYKEDDENNNCPPGIGYHNGFGKGNKDATLLHICIKNNEYIFFNFHYPITEKIFNIFNRKTIKIFYKDDYPINELEILLKYYFNKEYDKILRL